MKSLFISLVVGVGFLNAAMAQEPDVESVKLNLTGLSAEFKDEQMSEFVIKNDVNRFLPITSAEITGPTVLFYQTTALFLVRPDEAGHLQFTSCSALSDCREDILQNGEFINLRKLPRKLLQNDIKVDTLKMANHTCRGISANASDLMFVIQTKEHAVEGALHIAVNDQIRNADNIFGKGRPVYQVENKVTQQVAQMHMGDDLREGYFLAKSAMGSCKTVRGFLDFKMQIVMDVEPMTFSCEATWMGNYEVCPGF